MDKDDWIFGYWLELSSFHMGHHLIGLVIVMLARGLIEFCGALEDIFKPVSRAHPYFRILYPIFQAEGEKKGDSEEMNRMVTIQGNSESISRV